MIRQLIVISIATLALAGCGNSQMDAEAIGQAKKLSHVTPLICPNYYAFDLSLGIMRNGSGSMSTQDIWFTVDDPRDLDMIKKAVDTGSIVKVLYNVRRVPVCTEDHILTHIGPAPQ